MVFVVVAVVAEAESAAANHRHHSSPLMGCRAGKPTQRLEIPLSMPKAVTAIWAMDPMQYLENESATPEIVGAHAAAPEVLAHRP